jgi:hypothetical protein
MDRRPKTRSIVSRRTVGQYSRQMGLGAEADRVHSVRDVNPTAGPEQGEEQPMETMQNCVAEWSFDAAFEYADPFNEAQVDVVVTAADGGEQRVPAFWAGDSTWKVRFASAATGGSVEPDADGSWQVPLKMPPVYHDWVLILESGST